MQSLRALGLYAVLTVALTWPFAANLRVMDAGDSAFFAWEIGWTVHALKTDPAQLPHANIFHPLRYTLGMDEPVLGTTLLVLPLALFTDDAVLLYNVVRLLTFLLLGARRPTGWRGSWGRGSGSPSSPGRSSPSRRSAPTRSPTSRRSGRSGGRSCCCSRSGSRAGNRTRDALLAALFFVLGFLACGYHGVIAVAVLPPFLAGALLGPVGSAEGGSAGGRPRRPRAAAGLPDAPEGPRAGALRRGARRRRSCTRPRSSPSSRRARGTGSTAR